MPLLLLLLTPPGAGGARAAAAQSVAAGPGSVVDSLVTAGRLQEAAWTARALGDTARAEVLLTRLERILRRRPISAAPLSMDSQGVSYTFRLDDGGGVRSIFKVDGSDIFCRACGADREVAVYRIDRLLGLDLTPMTVFQRIVHEGDTLSGSAMYFVAGAMRPDETGGVEKPDALRLLDAIVGNSDRHGSNWLVTGTRRVVAIDHNRAFEYHPRTRPTTCWETEIDSIAAPGSLGAPYRRYATLPVDSLRAAVAVVVDTALVREFIAMRSRVVDRLERRIADPGRRLPLRDCWFRD